MPLEFVCVAVERRSAGGNVSLSCRSCGSRVSYACVVLLVVVRSSWPAIQRNQQADI